MCTGVRPRENTKQAIRELRDDDSGDVFGSHGRLQRGHSWMWAQKEKGSYEGHRCQQSPVLLRLEARMKQLTQESNVLHPSSLSIALSWLPSRLSSVGLRFLMKPFPVFQETPAALLLELRLQ